MFSPDRTLIYASAAPHWGICLYDDDVEKNCPQADGDEPAGDWATSFDCVHDVLVNGTSNAMLMFVLFFSEENLVSFLCCCFAIESSMVHK